MWSVVAVEKQFKSDALDQLGDQRVIREFNVVSQDQFKY